MTFTYPFEVNSFDRVICRNVLEHVEDFFKAVEEIWRFAKRGAVTEDYGPFMSSVSYFSGSTHRRAFTSRSFDYFIPGNYACKYGYSQEKLRMISVEYDKFVCEIRSWYHRWLLDKAKANKRTHESRFAFLYPVFQIYFVLLVLK